MHVLFYGGTVVAVARSLATTATPRYTDTVRMRDSVLGIERYIFFGYYTCVFKGTDGDGNGFLKVADGYITFFFDWYGYITNHGVINYSSRMQSQNPIISSEGAKLPLPRSEELKQGDLQSNICMSNIYTTS